MSTQALPQERALPQALPQAQALLQAQAQALPQAHARPRQPRATDAAPPAAHAIDDAECRLFREAAELAGRKWTAAILLALARGAERFSELVTGIEGISDRLLAARLRELEAQGLVTRTVIPSTPVQIRYGLTDSGAELITILQPLVRWAKRSELRERR